MIISEFLHGIRSGKGLVSGLCAILLSLTLLASCASNEPVASSTTEPQPLLSGPQVASTISDVYTIGVGDTLQIDVWKNPELSLSVPVRPDGKISMPLIGDILAAGLTTDELTRSITESLKTYLKQPQVSIIVTNPFSAEYQRRVRISGAVETPLSIPFRNGITVLDLVLLAGGTTEYANGNAAKLHRTVDGVLTVYPIRLEDILVKGDLKTNYALIPSDIVTVPEKSFFSNGSQ